MALRRYLKQLDLGWTLLKVKLIRMVDSKRTIFNPTRDIYEFVALFVVDSIYP